MSDDHDRAIKVATVALNRAMAGDFRTAADYIARLNGTDGLVTAIIAWCDTFIAHIHGPDEILRDRPVRMKWLNVETGQVEGADEAPEHARWAGRLIAARAANDEATFMALLRAPAEGAQLGDAIIALLQSVAVSLKNAEALRAFGGAS